MINNVTCAICGNESIYTVCVDGYNYFKCKGCGLYFTPDQFVKIDYDNAYWLNEKKEAERREREDCYLRALELIYLNKIPVTNLLDFGCGLGITVQLLRDNFGIDACGIDKYGQFEQTSYLIKDDILHANHLTMQKFDAIMAIEVVEHLPQDLILPIFKKLADMLRPGGFLLINTGMHEFMMESAANQKYVDPAVRGHISIFSIKTFGKLAEIVGLKHVPMWSRMWCTLLLKPANNVKQTISPWECLPENVTTLKKVDLMYPLVRQSLWAEELNQTLNWLKKSTKILPKNILARIIRKLTAA